jgi:hypothetical protein
VVARILLWHGIAAPAGWLAAKPVTYLLVLLTFGLSSVVGTPLVSWPVRGSPATGSIRVSEVRSPAHSP